MAAYMKSILFFISLVFVPFLVNAELENLSESSQQTEDETIEASASLLYYLKQELDTLDQMALPIENNDLSYNTETPPLSFDHTDVIQLWEKVLGNSETLNISSKIVHFPIKAFEHYSEGVRNLENHECTPARQEYSKAYLTLLAFWSEITEQDTAMILEEILYANKKHLSKHSTEALAYKILKNERTFTQDLIKEFEQDPSSFKDLEGYNKFDSNPHISKNARRKIKPYLLPENHPMKKPLDHIFFASRAIQDPEKFKQAGFITKFIQPRSFIRVAAHPLLPGYLVKVYLDNELREKRGKPGWHWFVCRCEGIRKIQKVINRKKIKYFVAPHKYLYPLPLHPAPPDNHSYRRKEVILLVNDMNLVPRNQNKEAWRTVITRSHLRELYTIISRGSGSSYREDNIAYTKNGKFAFIDTEYPGTSHDFGNIRPSLSDEMRAYWDRLVKRGRS